MEARYSAETLGQVIRELREDREPAMSQDELGRRANYGAGAGVSISRIEAGANRPSRQRFHDIARALDVDAEQLAELASKRSGLERERTDGDRSPQARRRGTRERLQAIQRAVKERTDSIDTLASAFNEAHERARDAFLLRFLAAGRRVPGAQVPELLDNQQTPGSAESTQQQTATNRTQATGRIGALSGRLLLIGIIAAPISLLAAGGLLFLARRRSKQEEQVLNSQLDESEAALDVTQHGFDALADVLSRATELLDYIGVHASHALDRWLQSIGTSPVEWADLTDAQQGRYQDFVSIAECQLSVDRIDAGEFLTFEGAALERVMVEANETLRHASRTVRDLV